MKDDYNGDMQFTTEKTFYAIGLGASAGGMQAMSAFFGELNPDINAALIVVTHLMRDRPSILDQILSRFTSIPVHRVEHDQEIHPGNVYVLVENTVLTIDKGWLRVHARDEKIENSAVDVFFHSLAADFRQKAIGVILSGGGQDGLKGALEITGHGGKVLVQDPQTARADGMPMAVIEHDHPSGIAGPSDLAEQLNQFCKKGFN